MFPYIAPFSIRDICNKYAPNEFVLKRPNDIVCKTHVGKTSGIISKKRGKFACLLFGLNRFNFPPDSLLRDQGLKGCCLKNHCKNVIPKPFEFIYEVGERIFELNEKYSELDSLLKYCNEEIASWEKNKPFVMEVNNRNADIDKDGFLWCSAFPNALIKVYDNGVLYDVKETFFDRIPDTTDSTDPGIQKVYKAIKEMNLNNKK